MEAQSLAADGEGDESARADENVENMEETGVLTDVMDIKKIYTKDYDLHKIRLSTTERLVEGVEPPTGHVLSDAEFWMPGDVGKPNCQVIKEHLKREGKISVPQLVTLVDSVY
jgi:hypothetical protein